MDVEPTTIAPEAVGADLIADARGSDAEALRTAAARAVRAAGRHATVACALDPTGPVAPEIAVAALAEGAVLGSYDRRRWRASGPPPEDGRFVICGAGSELAHAAARGALHARWTNVARELVDAPSNVSTPAALAQRAAALPDVGAEVLDPVQAGLPALAAVGRGGEQAPRLIVMRHQPPGAATTPRLAFVGKGVTFDAGGYFLKPRPDMVRQKADMAGGAAVLAAMGAIAELALPVSVLGLVPACENLIGRDAIRPTDVIDTAAGLAVEVTNPDAEGRLILADSLWYARQAGATHIVDLATLTSAMHEGMGDVYAGVFGRDDAWRDAVVAAGNDSGDPAWPWPLHPRYRPLIESTVADVRNNAARGFGFPIVAATFLERFAGDGHWAHVDMLGPALVDEDRGDALGAGATGYGTRMLIELATRLSSG